MKNFIITRAYTKPSSLALSRRLDIRSLWNGVILATLCLVLAACSPVQGNGGDNFLHPPTKAPTPTLLPPKEIDLSSQLDNQGMTLSPLVLDAPDGCLHLEVEKGVTLLNADKQPVKRLVIQQDFAGKLPLEAYGVPISYAYRFGPDGISFSAPIKVIFSCINNYKKTMLSEISVGIKGDDGKWDQLSVQGDDEKVWTRLENLQPGRGYLLVGPAPMGS
jgi:hypothetical protein